MEGEDVFSEDTLDEVFGNEDTPEENENENGPEEDPLEDDLDTTEEVPSYDSDKEYDF